MTYSRARNLDVALIQGLRRSVGWDPDELAAWEDSLAGALDVVSAWDSGQLVGIGFLVGSTRHAVLCDLTVRSTHQQQGIGRKIVKELLGAASRKRVRYVTLTFDERKPWLKSFYRTCGFEEINNAMQYRGTITSRQ